MKIVVLSDVTFDPVIKLLSLYPDIIVQRYEYADRLIPELLNIEPHLEGIDILIVHFDSYFYRYPDSYIAEILTTATGISRRFKGNILISNNLNNGRHSSILKENIGQQEQVLFDQEKAIKEILRTSNTYFYDVKKILSRIGLQNVYNFKLGFLYQMPYKKDFIQLLSSELASFARFLSTPEKKAIFVDCDNTLWKGILGEDGLEEIKCDKNARGILYFQFQEYLLEKKREGFILGLCSKNNHQDVQEAFEKLNMPLKWDDFLIKKVNWKSKSENLAEAAIELNISLDSFIFIDDSQFEIEAINSMRPEVYTIKLSDDYELFLEITDDYAFKRKWLTKEDLVKKEQYFAEQKRNEVKVTVQSFEEYIKGLAIKQEVTINNLGDFPRLSQLTEKTNQFNFNKEPFSIAGLEGFMNDKNLIYGLRVSDKFGDYGLVGLMLIEIQGLQATLRNFLLSCRALGRLIEDHFFDFVLNDLTKNGIELQEIIFKETTKNAPAKSFLTKIKDQMKMARPH
jgi:FkbH-like protein